MKALVLVSVLAIIPLAQGAERQFVAADNSPATKVCMAAATGSPMDYRLTVQYTGFNERTIGRALSCNEEPLARFAARYNQDERTVDRIYHNTPPAARVTITDLAAITNQGGTVTIQGVVP